MNQPSPAISIIGRHNSGKTTLIEQLIGELVARGWDVGSIKHHSQAGFSFDLPGKDSYRHRLAGASETVIAGPDQIARVKTIAKEAECDDLIRSMTGHDIILVEGYRKSGLPSIEIMREGNEADAKVAEAFAKGARQRWPLGFDFTQIGRGGHQLDNQAIDTLSAKMPTAQTIAIITDIPEAIHAADLYGIPAFPLAPKGVSPLADFLEERFLRP